LALEAAVQILELEGPDGLTTRAVAGRIGYTVGSLYFLFRNRDDLVLQVNARTLDELRARIDEALIDCPEARQALRVMGRVYLRFAAAHPARWRLIFEHGLPADVPLPASLAGKIEGLFTLVAGYLSDFIPGIAPTRARQAAQALWGGVHGITVLAITNKLGLGGNTAAEALTADLIDRYLSGLDADRPAE
jgi:AcrR family transcriptional regulator